MPTDKDCIELKMEEPLGGRDEFALTTAPTRVSTVARYFPAQTARISPGPTHLDRSDELRGIEGGPPQLIETYEPDGAIAMRGYLNDLPFWLEIAGWEVDIEEGVGGGTDEIQSLAASGPPTAGTFTLTFTDPGVTGASQETNPIAYNATAADVEAALEELPLIGEDNVLCAGGPLPGAPVTITFQNELGKRNIAALVDDDTLLTGGTVAITTTTPGVAGAIVDLDGATLPADVFRLNFTKRGGVKAKTAQLTAAYVDEGVFLRGQGYGVSSLALTAEGIVTGELMGLVLKKLTSDPNLTPVFDSFDVLPARRGDLYLKWLDDGGTVGDFSLNLSNPLVRNRTMSRPVSSFYPDELLHGDEKVRVTGSVPKQSITAADMDALIEAETFAAIVRYKLPVAIGATTTPYKFFVDMPACQVVGGQNDDLANVRRMGGTFDFFAAWDETLDYDAKLQVICAVEKVEDY